MEKHFRYELGTDKRGYTFYLVSEDYWSCLLPWILSISAIACALLLFLFCIILGECNKKKAVKAYMKSGSYRATQQKKLESAELIEKTDSAVNSKDRGGVFTPPEVYPAYPY